MPAYKYKARSFLGKISTGVLEGDNEADIRYQLRAQKLIPIKVKKELYKKSNAQYQRQMKVINEKVSTLKLFKPNIKNKDLQVFTRQLAVLINAGIPLIQALEILQKSSIRKNLKKALEDIITRISAGKKIDEAFKQHPHIFSHFYLNMIKAGEEGGILDTVLNQVAEYIEKITKLERKIKGAASYPIFIISAAVILVTGMLIFIVPKFQNMFSGTSQEIPGMTLMLIRLSELVREHFVSIAIVGIISIILLRVYLNTNSGKELFDYIKLRIPVIKDFIIKSSMAKFSKTFSCLTAAGVPIIKTIEIASKTSNNKTIEAILIKTQKDLTKGEQMSQSLSKHSNSIIPSMVIQMIAVGEQTGSLDETMRKVADFYENEVDTTVESITKLMEPVMIIVLGAIIGFIVVALYLPIFKMASTIAV